MAYRKIFIMISSLRDFYFYDSIPHLNLSEYVRTHRSHLKSFNYCNKMYLYDVCITNVIFI